MHIETNKRVPADKKEPTNQTMTYILTITWAVTTGLTKGSRRTASRDRHLMTEGFTPTDAHRPIRLDFTNPNPNTQRDGGAAPPYTPPSSPRVSHPGSYMTATRHDMKFILMGGHNSISILLTLRGATHPWLREESIGAGI